jgi:arsenate reductase
MAEGIARSLAPEGVRVSSAGALSSRVHPWAIEALEEIGIDIRHHVSECVSDVDLDSVDAVITLCADEVCPAFERPVVRVHWPMPDPAARGLATFREARDELQRRLGALFAP